MSKTPWRYGITGYRALVEWLHAQSSDLGTAFSLETIKTGLMVTMGIRKRATVADNINLMVRLGFLEAKKDGFKIGATGLSYLSAKKKG